MGVSENRATPSSHPAISLGFSLKKKHRFWVAHDYGNPHETLLIAGSAGHPWWLSHKLRGLQQARCSPGNQPLGEQSFEPGTNV